MALLLNARELSKRYGANALFRDISLTISDGERLGLIGPNGSGKSTLLEILAGKREPDSGEVALRKGTRLAYIAQDSVFTPGESIRDIIHRALETAGVPDSERQAREADTLGRTGFVDFDAEAATLSGGWRKRLAIAEALVLGPDLLLLDEPTNHLDLAGIDWLEKLLVNTRFACVVVSHDRYFLENVVTEVAELNRAYSSGLFQAAGVYSYFLEKREEHFAAESKRQDSLQNRVKTEIEWLRRGPKARATKAKARIDTANNMIAELADMNSRARTSTADLDFTATDRKTKRLVVFDQVSYSIDDRLLVDKLNFILTNGMRVGLVGPNGSGKTTLLRLIRAEVKPDSGEINRADTLRIVYFEQMRTLDPSLTLKRALAPDGDSVIFQDRVIHVASWAAKFLFTGEQLNQPVSRLSGGERARVLIAKLMLEPADVLLLDEPTNDLDIPTLEVLEETLMEFKGALILVTHDRYMLDRVSTVVLGLDGEGATQQFADYSQWEAWKKTRRQPKAKPTVPGAAGITPPTQPKRKLSYKDGRDYETIEQRIAEAEAMVVAKRDQLADPAVLSDGERVQQVLAEAENLQSTVDDLYARWAELEAKIG